ncbi:MAG TPA: hypothetical protein VGS12_13250 [Caulobacteraceae bacterium]|nr:hypothetical protein [Caulobacteraceae bacterium]
MAESWRDHGPVSTPPRSWVWAAAATLVFLALAGMGMGLKAAWRQSFAPDVDETQSSVGANAIAAKPIVQLPPPVTAPVANEAQNAAAANAEADTSKQLEAQTDAAQAVQAKAAASGNIDDIETSPAEKPPPPGPTPTVEAPPAAPTKSDVPF